MTMNKKHPYLDHLETQHKKGTISRREFIRLAACLGVGAGVGLTMPGLVKPALASAPKRGGVLKVAAQVLKATHPAQISWIMPSNIIRQVAEYLTYFGADNVVKPLLAESWEASDDLKTWTFNLRKGVKVEQRRSTSPPMTFSFYHQSVADQGRQVLPFEPFGHLFGQDRHRDWSTIPTRSNCT